MGDGPADELRLPTALALRVEQTPIAAITPYAGNARTHSRKQLAQIEASIRRFGFVSPILLADDNSVIAGHGRLAAAQSLGLQDVPTIRLSHLSAAERRAYVVADNRLAELAGWDRDLLAIELQGLAALDLDFDLELTGFDGAELDALLDTATADDDDDQIPEATGPAITRVGDIWTLGPHRLICGDARTPETYAALMPGEAARMVFTDPPYNVPIDGHVGGKGRIARRPFVMASGEMSAAEFEVFLREVLTCAAAVSLDGAIHFVCMDWRSIAPLIHVGDGVYAELKNLIAWVKANAGMGAFYRSQHELIAAFKVGTAAHVNNFGLGGTGRYRTNVWSYPGATSFGKDRDATLALHPTVKPVALVADAIRDVSRRGEIVLDPFGGSGSTLIAAERTGRHARLVELDPLYCDTICRRWSQLTGQPAILTGDGQTFDEVGAARTEATDAQA
ncbi:DNA methyltransferase [Phenylobacterium sp.]|uniref:site-specific DNA-methyltransferase n=1 Tax=Phenylobacterium sp. TaxID=1871053 RepID=UPI0025F355CA|nr:DNA methyltransferase [Phenylobacterium sp.]MBX3482412.1 site-specific DNA-methyltransferase [Phenylobacterium sp.]MCW5758206.1 site-specific DNA-methyltransferase [Phenylobacterium sp.]